MEKKTPLYDRHVALGGKMVEFGGFLMPVQYKAGVVAEHMVVREKVGLFDVSHMGEIRLSGPDAEKNIQWICTTDISKMVIGQIKYSMFCNENGGIVDDLVICKLADDDFMLVVNAGNRAKDGAWVFSHLNGDVTYVDQGDLWGELALQGPLAGKVAEKLVKKEDLPDLYYYFTNPVDVNVGNRTIQCLISQTGYTGEFGYEFYCKAEDACDLWDALLAAGEEFGILPCGLGARDTLRLEASMPLYGHEMTDEISPKEAGLFVRLKGKDYLGRDAIIARGTPKIKRVGFKVVGRGIPREHTDLYTMGGEKAGWISSGTHCPYLGGAVAMGYIPVEMAEPGTHFNADVRGRMVEVEVVELPFYKIEHNVAK